MRILASALLATALLTVGLPVQADPVGLVNKVQKTAYGTPPTGARTPKQPTDGVEFNELIETVRDSAIEIGFVDGSRLTLGAEATVKIDEFTFDSAVDTGAAALTLTRGSLRWVTGLMPPGTRLVTPTATITIRGTTLKLGVLANGNTIVALIDGLATVSGNNGQTGVDIKGGQSARVTPEGIEVVDTVLPVANAIVDSGWSRADKFTTGRDRDGPGSRGGSSGGGY